jgi:hypothetical protein
MQSLRKARGAFSGGNLGSKSKFIAEKVSVFQMLLTAYYIHICQEAIGAEATLTHRYLRTIDIESYKSDSNMYVRSN